jgi:GIY-YIG catalytic domain-containing protein
MYALASPRRLWSRAECLSRPSPVPAVPGLYGWYFRELPPAVDGTGCVRSGGRTLLYVGIAPSRPFGNNRLPSTSTLRSRIRSHYAGNAEGSTLRLTLGSLLKVELGLSHDPDRKTKSFGEGELKLSEWMDRNADVTWVEHREPWSIEPQVIASLNLPLNLAHNRNHAFWAHLTKARSRRPPNSRNDRGTTDA